MSEQSTQEDYLTERLEKQLRWHGDKSAENKRMFHLFQTIILGGIIVVVTSLIQLHKYQENWILHRTTAELLKKEKYLYLNDVGDHSGIDPSRKKKQSICRNVTVKPDETKDMISRLCY